MDGDIPSSVVMDLQRRVEQVRERFEARESEIRAFLPEDGRFERLQRDARALGERYPDPERRPPLFGVLVGIKDIFHVSGWLTCAGSRVPASALQGPEADSVARLRRAGALLVGKTVTTEFAYFEPGPTRNPCDTTHTPGGSSSGSAAAVAAGFCELALGTQTIGSIVRPAAFCGVVGLKPSYHRISTLGVIPLAPSLDHVGCLAADVDIATRAARVLCTPWAEAPAPSRRAVLGIPEGPCLDRVPAGTREWFDGVCQTLRDAGYAVRQVAVMKDFPRVCERNEVILSAEAARVHATWFREHGHLYRARTADLIRRGQRITDAEVAEALAERDAFRAELRHAMAGSGIDMWICPSTLGPAPRGLESTGDPVMSLPWTQAGLPVVSLPAGTHAGGLPMGVQLVGDWHRDEHLLAHAREIASRLGA
jgi:Asp-tRNA(Asn)/Glu-tRNA(Gln) amidotransferase A subunit family amidase